MKTDQTAEQLFQRGRRLLEAGHYREALRNLKLSHQLDPDSTPCLSYLGVALALADRQIRQGEELCRLAIRREFFQTDYFYNLGQVYLAAGQKDRAVWVFRKGLETDQSHRPIQKALGRLGYRRRPLVRFLPRSHFVNRVFGKIRTQIFA